MSRFQKLAMLKNAGVTLAMVRRAKQNGIDIDKLIELLTLVGDLILKILPLFLAKK